MVHDQRLINPSDGPATSDEPLPGAEEAAEAVGDSEGIGGVADLDPAERSTGSDLKGANEENERTTPPGD